MNKYFLEQSGFKLLMTATLGDPKEFLRMVGGKKCKYRRMESTFDYERSPIYFYPEKRMSLAQRDSNFDWMRDEISSILQKHPTDSGIIHSGSYEISGKLYQSLPKDLQKRVIVYTNSKEKEEAMKQFMNGSAGVLMGPSLLEGINLLQDHSRFQIFAKVPFPSLGDKYVSAKMNYQPQWYNWSTSLNILQGVGRSVRSETDWAVTYILDGCFKDVLNRSRSNFPPEFLKRIRLVKSVDI
jgi:Rad3-related DNA helicase